MRRSSCQAGHCRRSGTCRTAPRRGGAARRRGEAALRRGRDAALLVAAGRGAPAAGVCEGAQTRKACLWGAAVGTRTPCSAARTLGQAQLLTGAVHEARHARRARGADPSAVVCVQQRPRHLAHGCAHLGRLHAVGEGARSLNGRPLAKRASVPRRWVSSGVTEPQSAGRRGRGASSCAISVKSYRVTRKAA